MHSIFRKHAGLFFLAALFVTFSAGLGFADSFRTYNSEVMLMVLPQERAISTRETAENLVILSKTSEYREAFFDAIADRAGIYDIPVGSDAVERFHKLLTVSAVEQGSAVRIIAHFDDRDTVSDVAFSAAKTLARFAGRYYNIKTEAEFRIVDGPVVSREMRGYALWIVESIAMGFVATGIFFVIVLLLPEFISRVKPSVKPKNEKMLFRPGVFEPKKPEVSFGDHTHITIEPEGIRESDKGMLEESRQGERDELSGAYIREKDVFPKSGPEKFLKTAPLNLPIAATSEEEAFLREFAFEEDDQPSKNQSKYEAASFSNQPEEKEIDQLKIDTEGDDEREPTEEEYKRRLNELLHE